MMERICLRNDVGALDEVYEEMKSLETLEGVLEYFKSVEVI